MLLMSLVVRTEHLLKGRQVVGTPIREVSRRYNVMEEMTYT